MEDYIAHFGIKRRSGRYPYGSGERPYQGENRGKLKVSLGSAVQNAAAGGVAGGAIAASGVFGITRLMNESAIRNTTKVLITPIIKGNVETELMKKLPQLVGTSAFKALVESATKAQLTSMLAAPAGDLVSIMGGVAMVHLVGAAALAGVTGYGVYQLLKSKKPVIYREAGASKMEELTSYNSESK